MKMEKGDSDAVGDGVWICGVGGLRENQSYFGRVECRRLDLGACSAAGRLIRAPLLRNGGNATPPLFCNRRVTA
jgi:hypothetical protein